MIDVPVLVKDALRDGAYRKNYRFIVEGMPVPEGYYEIATLAEGQKFTFPHNEYSVESYKIVGDGPNAYTGITTWDGDEPLEWLTPTTVIPITEYTGYFAEGDVISVSGYSGISVVRILQWQDAREGETITIDNNNLVKESVSFDERMNSGDMIKYGLCEGTSLEFQYFGHANIYGKNIQAFLDVEYMGTVEGWAKISDFGTSYITITEADSYRVLCLNWKYTTTVLRHNGQMSYYAPVEMDDGYGYVFDSLDIGDELAIVWQPPFSPEANPCILQKKDNVPGLVWHTIPMGFFTVDKCARQASTGIMKVTAYNKLQSDYLDASANETLMELVENGEYGYTNEASLHTILKSVLADYGIEQESYSDIPEVFDGATSSNLTAITLCDDSGRATGSKLYLYMYAISMQLSAEDFYYFYLHTSGLKGYAKAFIWGNYASYKTKISDTIYTIDELANTLYSEGYDLCGEIYLRKRVDINTFFFDRKGGYSNITTPEYSKCYSIDVVIPVYAIIATRAPSIDTTIWRQWYQQNWEGQYDFLSVFKKDLGSAEKIRLTTAELEAMTSAITLRELQSAVYETQCQYGKLDRETDLFSGVELNQSRLLPQDSLYPATSLYPGGAAISGFKSMYSKLWADEGNIHKWRYLIITYKSLDGEGNETEYTLQRTVNNDGTDNYNCSDNWLFRNLVWTAEQIGEYADTMVAKMRDITWFPFEMWCAGLPYLETGDEIEIPLGEETYTSYILQRQLKGIQNLQDTYINGTLDIF